MRKLRLVAGRRTRLGSRIEETPVADLDPITPLIPVPPVPGGRGGRKGKPERPEPKPGSREEDAPADRPGVKPDGSVDEYA